MTDANDTPIYDAIEHPATVEIDGHTVDASQVDLFFDMKTGQRVTDEEWDETQRRLAAAADVVPPHLRGDV
jgi:hypothetical protein